MWCLIEAFKQMRRRGLLAKRECYCEHCAQNLFPKFGRRKKTKQGEFRGFVHVGEWDPPPSAEPVRVPLAFGTMTGDRISYRDAACLEVGKVVAACLDEQ